MEAEQAPADLILKSSEAARILRRWIVERSIAANVGHVGSALCIVDIMAVLFQATLRGLGPSDPDRDRFILGKGHAALALYGALRLKGVIDETALATFCRDGSRLGVHPDASLEGVEVSTGSLGQGLSIGCGIAYAARLRGRPSRTYVLVSDAECNEGQVWEAALFAAHHRLANLCVIVDLNGLQALGYTREILALPDPARLWGSIGWQVAEVDGHDRAALLSALRPDGSATAPLVVLARTVLGKGVSFMEDRLEWHYRNLTPELAAQALDELDRRP